MLLAAVVAIGMLSGCAFSKKEPDYNALYRQAKAAENAPPQEADKATRVDNRLRLATEYYAQGQFGGALRELLSAQEIYDQYAPLHNMFGVVYLDLKQYENSEKGFQRAIQLAPNDPEIHNNYGWSLCVRGNYTQGIQWLARAWDNPLYSTPEKALYNAGRCAKMQRDLVRAMDYWTKALVLSPQSTGILFEIAQLYSDQGKYKEAFQLIDRIHQIGGETPQSLWLAINMARKTGQNAEMESYGQRLMRQFPDAPVTALWTTRRFD